MIDYYEMEKESKLDYPIDAVITWVDGNDNFWRKKINDYSKVKINWSDKKETIRYNSINEIEIGIHSIIKNASFIHNIFLVTDNQVPKGFEKLKILSSEAGINLSIIDHTVIFRDYEHCLPCFNIRSIGPMLYRIPNLAEHFIVFDDDFFLMRTTSKEDFFKNGLPVIRGRWEKYYADQIFRNLYIELLSLFGIKKDLSKPGYKKAQQKSAKLVGTRKYIRSNHTPVSLRKSTIKDFYKTNIKIYENNVRHKFRDVSQFNIWSLANHLEVEKGTYYLENDFQLTYFQSYRNLLLIKLKLNWFSYNSRKLFMCFQNLEIAKQKELNYILNWTDNQLNKA